MKTKDMLTTFTKLVDSIYQPLQPVIENKKDLKEQLITTFPFLEDNPLLQNFATNVTSNTLDQMRNSGGKFQEQYKQSRNSLMSDPLSRRLLPYYIKESDTLKKCIEAIPFTTPPDKCRFLQNYTIPQFIRQIDNLSQFPSDLPVAKSLAGLKLEEVFLNWQNALTRREADMSGAITAAKTLLENVFKEILDKSEFGYDRKKDLPQQYKQAAKVLQLSPDKNLDDSFNQVFTGLTSVVTGLGKIRNKMGDAHHPTFKPERRHAELAVNLAGSLAMFLVETHDSMKRK